MIKNDEYFMRIALEEAELAFSKGEIPVGAVIVHENEIIARGHNLKELNKDVTAHAEIVAIRTASQQINNWRLEDMTMYVTLEPCPMCAGAIVQSRFKRLVFGALDNREGAVVSSKHIVENNHNHNMLVSSKILEEECQNIINKFLNSKRRLVNE
ncbi:MAG: nucleoside deaminase [Erysipelothrix sp.]|nr:nucleoside deaminase [Erysipelothrix sp.]